MKKKFKEEIRPEEQGGIELTDEQISVVSGGSAFQNYSNNGKNDNGDTDSGAGGTGGSDGVMPQTRDHILNF